MSTGTPWSVSARVPAAELRRRWPLPAPAAEVLRDLEVGVDHLVERLRPGTDEPPMTRFLAVFLAYPLGMLVRAIATGGLAILFDKHTDIFDAVDADLTLEGMAILAEKAK